MERWKKKRDHGDGVFRDNGKTEVVLIIGCLVTDDRDGVCTCACGGAGIVSVIVWMQEKVVWGVWCGCA